MKIICTNEFIWLTKKISPINGPNVEIKFITILLIHSKDDKKITVKYIQF